MPPPLGAGVEDGCCGSLAVPCHWDLGMEGMCCSALGCRQGCELYAVPPHMQVNDTLNTITDKVQEGSQDVVSSKQGFVSLSQGSLFPSHPIPVWSPPLLPLCCLQPWLSPGATMLMLSLSMTAPFPSSRAPHCPRLWQQHAAACSTNLSPSPAETQEELGLIRQEIRSLQEQLQEQLPFGDVEESVGAFVGNATSVLNEYREPTIALDGLR